MTTRNIVPRGNNEGGVGTTSKKWANVWGVLVNALTLSAQTIGFTIAGGTTSKTLTVDETVALSAKAPLISPSFTTPTSDVIKFGTTPTVGDFVEGKLYYDNLWKTLSLEAGRDITLQIGQEEYRRVYNTGAKILNGQAVYTNGVYSGVLPHVVTVALANAGSSSTSFVLGVATQDIDTNTYGFVTVRGNINGVKTDYAGWAVGDSLYISVTNGLITNVKPDAPNMEVRVGRVIDVHATLGIINVRITPVYQLDNLADVAVSGVVANQILKFDGVSWVPADSATTASAGGTNFFLTDSETAIEGLSRANPCIVTWTGHGLVDGGHQVKFEGITQAGWTALNSASPAANLWHTVTVINENSFSIPVNTSGYAAAYVPASDPGIYCTGKLLQTPDGTISESIDAAQSTGNVEALLDVYATSSPLGRTTIEGGEWAFDTWGYASSATDTNVIVIRVFKRSAAGSETALFNISTADLGTTVTLSRISTIQPAFTILATDHLVVRYFAKSDRGAGAYRQIYLVHGGTTHYSLFKTPLAVAHNQLGGLNTTGYRHLPAAVADSDFAVGQASDGNWIKKTLAETQTILRSGLIAASISDSDTTHAPDGNSVFDALALKAPLTSPALITPNLGTPSAGVLTACTTATAADNTATTALASTAFAKSQDAVLARLPDQAVNMTAAASGSSGIAVADNDNIDFGTGNFTLVWRGSLPDWTPSVASHLVNKYGAGLGYYLGITTSGKISFFVIGSGGTAINSETVAIPTLSNGTAHEILGVYNRETSVLNGSVVVYIDGVFFETVVINAGSVVSILNNGRLSVLGIESSGIRTAGTCSFAATYNRALTAAEVLDLYRNGISYSDKWGSQVSIFTGTNSDMSGANSWTNSGLATFNVNTTVAGKAYLLGDGDNDSMYILSSSVTIGTYFISLKARLNAGASTTIYAGKYPQPSTLGMTTVEFTPTGTEATYSGIFTILSGYEGAIYIGRAAAIGGFNGVAFEIDDVLVYKLGATLALQPEGIQPSPGQWLDSSSNNLHAMQPATGSSLTRFKDNFEVKWINTWAASHEAQYIGGINQAILPVGCYIDSIIGVITGATIEDIIIGDGSDTDRWVTITTGLAASTKSFTIASPISDGTNYKLVVDPDANFTGSIAWTITGRIL